ncbi:helix-turn-helix transcriptional regulator [Olivibacter domesticus]|uniref:Predicted DNA-binding transcriptional regulator YafY, contains an HTH and WYL domains n=1 Tax=Olivibacter domesticus TaxID=407022 RepID=A0A1H7I1G0_OLID1|nr:YafY family protein [Olivibacter domesticus]SEK55667.1 Predicted DNA-binding transcriptional regulator YafY, contains an HTH and WYL domains [Olivibacter domesticus]
MNRIDRLFGIVTLLQSRKYVSVEMIAEKFEISTRTVYRDIRAINEQGVPICFEAGKGYFIVQGYFLPPISFNNEEANALILMERFLNGFADRSIQKHYIAALNKVKNVMRSQQKEQLEFLNDNIKLQIPARLTNDFEYLSDIQNAIAKRMILKVDYEKENGEHSCREVEPIGLVFYAFSWHMIAWCHLRREYRDFKVSRIKKLLEMQIPFRKLDHVPVAEFMKRLPVDY